MATERSSWQLLLILSVITIAGCASEPERPIGAWSVADNVQLELYEDSTFSFYSRGEEGYLRSYTGTYRYQPDASRLEFRIHSVPKFTWESVTVSEEGLTVMEDDEARTLKRAEPVQVAAQTGAPVASIFGFDPTLSAQLVEMGGDVEDWWLGMSSFRWDAEGFEGARLYKAVDPSLGRSYITIDWWNSAASAESFARLFRAGVFHIGPVYEGPEPELFEEIDVSDVGEPGEGEAAIIAFLDPPEEGQPFNALWFQLRSLVLSAEGYVGHRLYNRVSIGGRERIGVVEFSSAEAAQAVHDSQSFIRIVQAFGHSDRVGVFTPIAEDMTEGDAQLR